MSCRICCRTYRIYPLSCLLLLVTACGSPFSAKIGPPDADTDNSPDRGDRDMGHTDARGDRTDSSPDHKDSAPDHTDRKDGGQLVDGGHKDVVFPDVAPWDSPVGDVHADGSPRDVVSSWDTGPVDTGCTPLTSTFQTGWCYSPGITTPGAYCVTSTSTGQHAGTTPAECQCAATFTCACLVAAGDPCDGHGVFTSCTDGGGMGPDVICS